MVWLYGRSEHCHQFSFLFVPLKSLSYFGILYCCIIIRCRATWIADWTIARSLPLVQQLVLTGLVMAFNVLIKTSVGLREIQSSKNDADEDSYFLGCYAVPTAMLPIFRRSVMFSCLGSSTPKRLDPDYELLSSETSVLIYQETRRYQPIIIKNLEGVRFLRKGVRPPR